MADSSVPPSSVPPSEPPTSGRPLLRGGFALNVVPALVWTLAIFAGGSSATPHAPVVEFFGFDKVQHIGAFLGLQLLSYRAFRYGLPAQARPKLRWLGAVASVLVGILLEIYQLGLPDRSAEVADVVADAVGAVLGALALRVLS